MNTEVTHLTAQYHVEFILDTIKYENIPDVNLLKCDRALKLSVIKEICKDKKLQARCSDTINPCSKVFVYNNGDHEYYRDKT